MSDFRVDVAIIGAGVVGLAIAEALSESGKEVLIPVVPEIVRAVDVQMGIVTITPMDGLLG